MNLHDPGFLHTSGFSTGFANDKYTSAVPSASVDLLATLWIDVMIPEIQCWSMMPPSFSHYYLEEDWGRDEKAVEMASLDVEIMKWEWVMCGRRGRGKLVVLLVKFAWIRACVKSGLIDDPNYPDQQKCKP